MLETSRLLSLGATRRRMSDATGEGPCVRLVGCLVSALSEVLSDATGEGALTSASCSSTLLEGVLSDVIGEGPCLRLAGCSVLALPEGVLSDATGEGPCLRLAGCSVSALPNLAGCLVSNLGRFCRGRVGQESGSCSGSSSAIRRDRRSPDCIFKADI